MLHHQQPLTAARTRDLAVLHRELWLAGDGPRFVRLTGEPWSGKSRLLYQLAATAHKEGWTVASGRVPRAGRTRLFEVVVDALDDHLARADGSLFERLGEARTRALAPVFPALATLPGAGERPDPGAAVRALRALLGLLGERGTLFVLDDVHRAGPEVFDLLDHLVRHPPAAPVLTVFAHRSVPGGRHLSAVPYDAAGVCHLALAPLPAADARALLPGGTPALAAELVLRDAAGVPGLLHALSRGAQPGPRLYGTAELATGIPPVLAPDAIDLHTLSSLGWRCACAAAVLGDPFTAAALARTAGMPVEHALGGIDELHGEGLVRPDGGAGTRFRFVHPAVRALTHHAAGAGWRSVALGRALEALRAEAGGRQDGAGGDGAGSDGGAGDGGSGDGGAGDAGAAARHALAAHLEHAPEIGLEDIRSLALSARAGLYTRPARAAAALRRVMAAGAVPVEVRLLLNKALVLSGRLEEAVRGYEETGPRSHEDRLPGGRTDTAVWQARALRWSGRHAQARSVLDGDGGLPPGGPAADAERAALALEPRAGAGPEESRRAAEQALRTAPADDPGARGHAYALLAAACAAAGDGPSARVAADEAQALLARPGGTEPAARLEALRWLGAAETELGEPERARRHLEPGLAAALGHGQAHLAGLLALGLVEADLAAGHAKGARERIRLTDDLAKQTAVPALAAAAREAERRIGSHAGEPLDASRMSLLSERERVVTALVGEGRTNQQIAVRLDISVKTVETYMGRIFKKLGMNSRTQVAHIVGLSANNR
ncbi:LuxR family transcriptional regulator [Streptomyces sp. NBC_00091]|uniref:helix-turn-helix transcriptional regulator n=1 Tax=Streptomyces sp. NBC_00091 TaxID=2975648 RepID=UPI0022500CA9|nr:LuxR family transcriptional regulator [Streptomyces sp. NBC_00091]MCX5381044.1 LuxR C-terminal-related transcriptional regulator [Streptomyces sp. NBC_00091]